MGSGKSISEWIVARGEGGMTPIVTLGFVFTERLSVSGVLLPLGFWDDFLESVPKLEFERERSLLGRGEGSRETESERSLPLVLLLDDFENFERKLGAIVRQILQRLQCSQHTSVRFG